MDQIWQIILSVDWTQFGKWGALIAAVLVLFRDKLPAVKNLKIPFLQRDVDVDDLAAVKQLEARGERRGCPKLQEAVGGVEKAFFNKGTPKSEG
jgi:hypothetical protein